MRSSFDRKESPVIASASEAIHLSASKRIDLLRRISAKLLCNFVAISSQ
ncbi:hypothetical protein ACVIW0_005714 [Bradyrhizobium sp. USDA 4454]